jgi:hypothetical protein
MGSSACSPKRGAAAEDLVLRKSRELVAPDDEIEAWELDTQDLNVLNSHRQDCSLLPEE